MSMMQFVPRMLLSQRKLATQTLARMYNTQKRIGLRRRRLELMKPSSSVPCYMALRRSENRCNQPRLKSLIDECIVDDPCGMAPLPMDLDHYTPSDKKERKYQRTWCECYVLPKKFVQAKKSYPNRPRRKLRRDAAAVDCVEAPPSPYVVGAFKPEKLVELPGTGPLPCCNIPTEGCDPARRPPICRIYYPPSCCKKRRTQYPSFSECKPEGLLDPIQPCECARSHSICELWAYWRRFHQK